jgi:V8-like Glu-specific endopeptidase
MGGKAVQDGDFPWAVAIYAYGQYICSGTLISKRHVLTAAHCFQTLIDTGDGSCTIEGDSKERPRPMYVWTNLFSPN